MIDISIKGHDRAERVLVKIQQNIQNPVQALKQIGEVMVASVHKNFEAEGRPQKWAPLSAMALNMRRNKNKNSVKILQDTGRLRNSITYAVNEPDQSVSIGTNVKYGEIHQYGGKINIPARTIIPKKAKVLRFMIGNKIIYAKKVHQKARTITIPRRPFLMFQEDDLTNIRTILLEHLQNEDNLQTT